MSNVFTERLCGVAVTTYLPVPTRVSSSLGARWEEYKASRAVSMEPAPVSVGGLDRQYASNFKLGMYAVLCENGMPPATVW